jgi:hypothetical protein
VCGYDQTHVFKLNGLYALPFHGNRFVEGWQLTGILTANSGLPVNMSDGYDEATGGSTTSQLCSRITILGRPVRGPDFKDFDFALLKDTRLREAMSLQLRAEFFNIASRGRFSSRSN